MYHMNFKHSLHVSDPWLSYIQSGQKTVEGRKNTSRYDAWQSGDIVRFYNDARSVLVKIKEIKHYTTLEAYLEAEGFDKVLPGISSFEEARRTYYQWSTPEEIAERGFLGIHIEVVHSAMSSKQ